MQRIPPPNPDDYSPAQCQVVANVVNGPRGTLRGPVTVWLHRPDLADRAQSLGAYCRFSSSLPARLSELAILVTAKWWHAGYEWNAHLEMGLRQGLTKQATEAIRRGDSPQFANEDEITVYEFAVELNRQHAVSDATWDRAHRCLGTAGVIDLIGVLGYYSLISMTINAVRIGQDEHAAVFTGTQPIAAQATVIEA